MTIISAAVLLFLVMDPLGNVPMFLSALKNVSSERQNIVIIRELLIALLLLIIFLFTGQYLLSWFHITGPALTISGGVILFLIAIRMVFPSAEKPLQERIEGEPFIVPLAVPYVVGPSSIATVMLMMTQNPAHWPKWLTAVFLAWLASSLILFFAIKLKRFLSERILIAMERLMGMLLITLAVQMLMTGIDQFIQH
ncbi:MarC family protein [Alkanindiges sp. WGS2144]|uniref:MarC family protein n=1 Tax=Alkanindiges sp. WGS2144 TaxID=3366808 RepID=UPI003753E574